MNIEVALVNAFCANGKGGNPAGVVLNADSIHVDQKRNISAQVGYSETAFVEKSDTADFKITFFTPTDEVDFCGHAIVATYSLLLKKGIISPGHYTQELKAGNLQVEVQGNGFVLMDQKLPIFGDYVEVEKIRECLHNDLSLNDLKPQIVSTGLCDIFLPVSSLDELNSLEIDFEKLAELNKQTNTIGLHAFTLAPITSNTVAHTRNFAPLYGIKEESATGSSNGALACYLFAHGKLSGRDVSNLKFEQGYAMNNPSEITVGLQVTGGSITGVQVGGFGEVIGEQSVFL